MLGFGVNMQSGLIWDDGLRIIARRKRRTIRIIRILIIIKE